METNSVHILIVDDEILNLEILTEYLHDFYQISTALDGQIAWDLLQANPEKFDVVLLDRMMPNMNGLTVLQKMKEHPLLQHCPVIFQTAKASIPDVVEGINAGAYYYLTKPFREDILLSVIRTAVSDRLSFKEVQNHLRQTKATLGLIKTAGFEFKTLEEAHAIASLIANACPKPETIVMGITELIINAIEHGNLGITYAEKTQLNQSGEWNKEVSRRLNLPENTHKTVCLHFQRTESCIIIIIIDQGNGFDWHNYMDFDPNRIMDNHGRGIAIANKLSFSSVEYRGNGNEVRAYINL